MDPERFSRYFIEEGTDVYSLLRSNEIHVRLYSDPLYADIIESLIPRYQSRVCVDSASSHLSELADYPQYLSDLAFEKSRRKFSRY